MVKQEGKSKYVYFSYLDDFSYPCGHRGQRGQDNQDYIHVVQ